MKKLLLIFGLLLALGATKAHATNEVCSGTTTGVATSTLSCSGSITVSANASLVASTWGNATNFPPTISGCGATNWTYSWPMYTGGAQGWMWILNGAAAGTCTPTVTFASSSTPNAVLQVQEYPCSIVYCVEALPWGANGVSIPYTFTHIQTVGFGPTDSVGIFAGGCNGSWTADSPWVSDGSTGISAAGSINFFIATGLGPGTSNVAVHSTCGGTGAVGYFILRTVLPSIGSLQQQFCTTDNTATSITCTLPQPSTTGNSIHIFLRWRYGAAYSVTTNLGTFADVCTEAPGQINQVQVLYAYNCPLPTTPPGSPVYFTFTAASGDVIADVLLSEVTGTSLTGAIAGNYANELVHDTGINPNVAGPSYLWQPGNYYLEAIMIPGTIGGSPPNTDSFLPAAPFAARLTPLTANAISFFADGTVDVFAPPSPETASITTGQTYEPGTYLWAWSAAPYTYPVVLQNNSGFANTTSITQTINEPSSNGVITDCASSNAAGAWSISSSPSLTWHTVAGGGSGDNFIAAYATAVPAGLVTVTTNANGSLFAALGKIANLNTLDTSAGACPGGTCPSALVASTSAGPVNIIPGGTYEFAVACGYAIGTSTGANTIASGISGTVLNLTAPGFSDGTSVGIFNFFAPTVGTYGATFTTDNLTQSSTAGVIMMFDTTVVPPASSYGTTQNGNTTVSGSTTQDR